jgi:hypothetical protein
MKSRNRCSWRKYSSGAEKRTEKGIEKKISKGEKLIEKTTVVKSAKWEVGN